MATSGDGAKVQIIGVRGVEIHRERKNESDEISLILRHVCLMCVFVVSASWRRREIRDAWSVGFQGLRCCLVRSEWLSIGFEQVVQ